VTVVKSGGKITDVTIVSGTAHGRQYEAIISSLPQAAIAAGSTNFANITGATFTTNAFKQAVENALAKF
jgi:uncharacterized protein with FMN-binding domain